MSTTIQEITELDEMMNTDPPPCCAGRIENPGGPLCGKPSVARIRCTCLSCHWDRWCFYCGPDLAKTRAGLGICPVCNQMAQGGL